MAEELVADLPDDLREWIDDRADRTGMDADEVLARSVAAARFLDGESDALAADGERIVSLALDGEDAGERLESLDENAEKRLDALGERVGELEDGLDEKIDDVRQRVIQVKRETDNRAPADHSHERLREQSDEGVRIATAARDAIDELEEHVDRGFDNFEDILDYLTDTVDEQEEKWNGLARMVIDLRERVNELEGDVATRRATAELKEAANRNGISAADCEHCGTNVQIGLLVSPLCPNCETTFRDVEPGGRFLRSATLLAGDRPALESGGSETPSSPAELFEDYAPERRRR